MQKPFELPERIVSSLRAGNLVIFAGAGVSTEGHYVFPETLFDTIKKELGPKAQGARTFSDLMTRFCAQPDGRLKLLHRIKHRMEDMLAYPEIYRVASRFHRELATIPYIREIVTTNWDDLFERECSATPIVTPQDFAVFSDIPGRVVLKIHGSINNYGSIIATEKDHAECYMHLKSGIIGAKLKLLLASKVIVFVGYSFEDQDFLKLYRILTKEVEGLTPLSYIVTLDEKAKKKTSSLKLNATPIVTDATFFVKQLKAILVKKKLMLPDERLVGLYRAIAMLRRENDSLLSQDFRKRSEMLFSIWYRNGLFHSLENLTANRSSGLALNSDNVSKASDSALKMRRKALRTNQYHQATYLTGYISGLRYFIGSDKERAKMPHYYLYGMKKIFSLEECLKLARNASKDHKSAYDFAKKAAHEIHSPGVTPHIMPVLALKL